MAWTDTFANLSPAQRTALTKGILTLGLSMMKSGGQTYDRPISAGAIIGDAGLQGLAAYDASLQSSASTSEKDRAARADAAREAMAMRKQEVAEQNLDITKQRLGELERHNRAGEGISGQRAGKEAVPKVITSQDAEGRLMVSNDGGLTFTYPTGGPMKTLPKDELEDLPEEDSGPGFFSKVADLLGGNSGEVKAAPDTVTPLQRKRVQPGASMPANAKQARDGKWYVPDPKRPGKYLEVVQ